MKTNTSGLIKRDHNAKVNVIESKIPSTTGLASTAAVNAVENRIPHTNDFVKTKKKQILMQKYQTLKVNISPHLIMINLWVKYLM